MKYSTPYKSFIFCVAVIFFAPIYSEAQCELFKSEIEGVEKYISEMSSQVDSLKTFAESAAFAAQYNMASSNARKVEFFIGKALTSAELAVSMASEAQYYSEVCGIEEVKSYTIDAESLAIDARDYAEEANTNAKKANKSINLGDVRYYMRKSQKASIAAQKSADLAAYAAVNAYNSCDHNDTHTTASRN